MEVRGLAGGEIPDGGPGPVVSRAQAVFIGPHFPVVFGQLIQARKRMVGIGPLPGVGIVEVIVVIKPGLIAVGRISVGSVLPGQLHLPEIIGKDRSVGG